jgi:hypothetical protein
MKKLQHYLNVYNNFRLKEDGIVGPKTIKATQEFVKFEIERRGWVQPQTELVWLRYDKSYNNTFNDFCLVYVNGKVTSILKATTTPGDYWIYNPVTVGGITGCACMCEQQVIEGWQWKTDKDWSKLWLKAPHFKQVATFKIYRDGNKDKVFDRNIIVDAPSWCGLNGHRMGAGTVNWNWSGGCNGTSDYDWKNYIVPVFEANKKYNYTLIEL